MRHGKLALAGLAAALLMAIAVSDASANRLSVSNQNFRVVWTSLEFLEEAQTFGTVRCPVTLEGSFHSATISKVENALVGHVSRASVAGASCTGGTATILEESLPWHVTYQGFSGTLPRITRIRLLLVGAAFRIHTTILGREFFCLATTTTTNPAAGEAAVEAGGSITTLTPDSANRIPTVGAGGEGCPSANGHFKSPAGDGAVTLLGNTTRIRVTLI